VSYEQVRELFTGIFLPLVLGGIGCAVRICRFGVRSGRQLLASGVTSCFVSVLVFWGLDLIDLPPTVDAAIVGFSGYMSGTLLDAFQDRALRIVGKGDVPPTKKGGDSA
jgi:hypothetical protein